MATDPKSLLKELYQALSDRPLEPDDPFYVPYMQDDREEPDPVARLLTEIQFSPVESLHMVSGQRGTGKSTELLRLKSMLKEEGYIVFHIDMLDYIHTSEPVEISDFLLASSIALAEAAKEEHQLNEVYESYWQRLIHFVNSEIELEEVTVNTDILGFGAEFKTRLKRDDSFKQQLQKATRGHINRLVEDTHKFVVNLITKLRQSQNNPDLEVVFIIDSFEQIRGHINNADQVHNSIIQLFSTHGRNLKLPMIHMIITVPPI